MTSEALRLLDEELALVEQAHHDTTMLLAHEFVRGDIDGEIEVEHFKRYCAARGHTINTHTAESTLLYALQSLIGESHD